MMCFLNPTRDAEAVSLVTRLSDTHQGVTVQVFAILIRFFLFKKKMAFLQFFLIAYLDLHRHIESVAKRRIRRIRSQGNQQLQRTMPPAHAARRRLFFWSTGCFDHESQSRGGRIIDKSRLEFNS